MHIFIRSGVWASLVAWLMVGVGARAQESAAPGAPIGATGRLDPKVQKIVAEISEERIGEVLKKLESFGTRHTLSDPTQKGRGIGAAREWILSEMKSYSPRLEVSFDTHVIPKGGRVFREVELRNVVAVLPGKMREAKERWIVIGGHYDTVSLKVPEELRGKSEQIAELPAPGVSDDGSGVACVMECARVMSRYEFDATLVFVAFAGEEQGLVGAHALAKKLKAEGREVQAVLNNDIIGTETSGSGASDNRRVLVFSEDPNDSPSRQIARYVKRIGERYVPGMEVEMVFRHDRFGRGGDHTAFNQEGFAGVRFTTPNENYADQHSPTDTLANASVRYAAKVVRVNAAVAAEMALAPRAPVTNAPAVELRNRPGLSRGASGYDAVLRWQQREAEPDLAGFVVVMRKTTSADWEREVWAGEGREFVMKDTPIDRWVFGVKAVDKEGHESPASAYVAQVRRVGTYE